LALPGARPFDHAMADYQRTRDEHALAMYEFTCDIAMLAPPPPERQQLFRAMRGNRAAMDSFAQVNAGISPAAFFCAGESGLDHGKHSAPDAPAGNAAQCKH
jgi:hypothetical protein